MIFNVRKMLDFYAIRGIYVFLKKGHFLWGRKGGSADFHRTHNLTHKKFYFVMILTSKECWTFMRFAVF